MSNQRRIIDSTGSNPSDDSRKRRLRTTGVFVVIIGVALLATSALGGYPQFLPEEPPAEPDRFTQRELPPEWQWSPKGVEYEHMYMERSGGRGQLDWIRDTRRSGSYR